MQKLSVEFVTNEAQPQDLSRLIFILELPLLRITQICCTVNPAKSKFRSFCEGLGLVESFSQRQAAFSKSVEILKH